MQTKTCPECGDDIYISAKSHKCGWREYQPGNKSTSYDQAVAERNRILVADARRKFEESAPTSHSLTEQQWYNVCRFWPTVARRCSRKFADVGPNNPLHATSSQGPLFNAIQSSSVVGIDPAGEVERRRIEAELERRAIQAE